MTTWVRRGRWPGVRRGMQRGPGTPPTPFTPVDLPNLVHWWSADDLVLDDDDPVTVWTDSVGALDAAPGGAGTEPLYKAAGINGLPALLFNGTTQYIARGPTPAINQPYTVIIVAQAASVVGTQTMVHLVNASTGMTAGNWFLFGGSFFAAGAADTAAHLHIATFNGAASSLRHEGVDAVSGDGGAGATAGITIGAGAPSTESFSGYVAHVIICDAVLSAIWQTRLFLWAFTRYAIGA